MTSVLNKALIVRFGHQTEQEKPPSPNLPTQKSPLIFNKLKLPRATTTNSLKSTSLIMSTMSQTKTSHTTHSSSPLLSSSDSRKNSLSSSASTNDQIHQDLDFIMPKQLDALKKLYEDAGELSDDCRADEEVRSYMMEDLRGDDHLSEVADDSSTILSGSWRKIKAMQVLQAYKEINENTITKSTEIDKKFIKGIEPKQGIFS